MNYRPRGATLRLKDAIAKMNGYTPKHEKVVYSKQEKDSAQEVLHRLLEMQESNTVSFTKPVMETKDV